ncbi:hypothetical protein [Natronoflexus pectinivorans]|nr:hypothetical protein [Natronoflexus pectinivorans]
MLRFTFLLFVLSSFTVGAQISDNAYGSITQSDSEISINIIDKPDLELVAAKQLYLEQCLYSYAKQKERGIMLSMVGVAISGVGISSSNDVLSYGGGAMSLIGVFISLNANKWLKRTTIQPSQEGAVFKFRF